MTNYIEYKFKVAEVEPFNEIIIAMIAELPFESFVENEEGFDAYMPKTEENIDEVKEVIDSIENIEFSYTRQEIEQQNWNATWEENFTPILVNDQCLIRAEFHETIENIPYEIVIQPKMSFGTGHHSTTHLMVEYILETDFTKKDILDMGCGTSVLAIYAKMKGAKDVLAIDIDEWSVENSKENAERNNVELRIELGTAENLGKEKFDIILANINRNILISDIPTYVKDMNQGSELLLSGLCFFDVADILEVCKEQGLKLKNKQQREEWCSLLLEK